MAFNGEWMENERRNMARDLYRIGKHTFIYG